MASRRNKAPERMSASALIRRSTATGKGLAKEVLEVRAKQRRQRARRGAAMEAVARPRRARRLPLTPRIPAKTRALLGPKPTSGVLIAEGDSWFDYPGQDVLRLLEDDYLFDVESVAHKGDRVEDMAHSEGQLASFTRRLEKLLRDDKVPRAILLSGGGNDIAGDELALLLNHAASPLPALNELIASGVIDVRMRAAYATMIASVTQIAQAYLGRPVPIVTHGYDYALPDGRGFLGGWWFLPGPWLEPSFRLKGHADFERNKRVIVSLIDQLNTMLAGLSSHPGFGHVHHLDLRGTLAHGAGYKKDWSNELHPSAAGFGRVTKKFADLLMTL